VGTLAFLREAGAAMPVLLPLKLFALQGKDVQQAVINFRANKPAKVLAIEELHLTSTITCGRAYEYYLILGFCPKLARMMALAAYSTGARGLQLFDV